MQDCEIWLDYAYMQMSVTKSRREDSDKRFAKLLMTESCYKRWASFLKYVLDRQDNKSESIRCGGKLAGTRQVSRHDPEHNRGSGAQHLIELLVFRLFRRHPYDLR
jgi:hypothetical protein